MDVAYKNFCLHAEKVFQTDKFQMYNINALLTGTDAKVICLESGISDAGV